MKNLFFLILFLGLSVQLSAAAEVVDPASNGITTLSSFILPLDFDQPLVATQFPIGEEKLLGCFIINACGTNAQWCDGGLHPPLGDYIRALKRRFCDQIQA